jgi:hypothetical protein
MRDVSSPGADQLVRSESPAAPVRRRARAVVAIAVTSIIAIAAAAALGIHISGSGGTQFVIMEQPAGEVVYQRSIEVGETFVLEHEHSVTRRPVIETFSVADPDTIAIEELSFDVFGANLPAGPEVFDHDVTFLHEDGAYRVLHHGFEIGLIPLRVGSSDVDHVLTFSDQERVRLLEITRRGAWVDLLVRGG